MALDLTLAKQHLRVLHDSEDTLIESYMAAAASWVEGYTGKLLTRREITQNEAAFCKPLRLFYGPNPASVTVGYTDADDAPQSIADAVVNRFDVYPLASWPTVSDNTPVKLTYTAGYETVPTDLVHAQLMLIGYWYDNREAVSDAKEAPFAVEALCRPYRDLNV